jgi:hypothetical protein
MYGEHQHGNECQEFEALLSDALDGKLEAPILARFHAHAAACDNCGPMLAATQAGMNWLKALPEAEPPLNLLRNILIATTGAEAAAPVRTSAAPSWRDRLRGWTHPLAPAYALVLQPRFSLSLGMAFFSVMVLMNAAGLHLTGLRAADLRPSAIQSNLSRTYYETTGRVVKYYENIRFVYEIESRVREIRNATRQEDEHQQERQNNDKPKDKKYRDDNTSGHPQPKQENYSRQNEPTVLAGAPREWPLDLVAVPRRAA